MLDDASSFVTEKLGGLKDVKEIERVKNLDPTCMANNMDDLENEKIEVYEQVNGESRR